MPADEQHDEHDLSSVRCSAIRSRRSGRRRSRRRHACTFSVRMRTGVWIECRRSARSERLARAAMPSGHPDPVRPRRRDGVHVGQPIGEAEPTLREHGVLLVDGQRDRAATATAEEEAVRAVIGRPGRFPVRSDSTWSNRLSSCAVALLASEPGDRDVERRRQDQEDDAASSRRSTARGCAGRAGPSGCRRSRRQARARWSRSGQDPVRHRPDDSPRRGRSRSACRPSRACRAGSGRRRRPRSASPRR